MGSGIAQTHANFQISCPRACSCASSVRAVQREANQLVEEFMLAANMAAAGLVSRAFPARALLRRHPPPHQRKMDELALTAAGLVGFSGLYSYPACAGIFYPSLAIPLQERSGQLSVPASGL